MQSIEQATIYFKELGHRASELDINIDLFCMGLQQFCSNVLQNLVQENGGTVIMQKEFNKDFGENLKKSILQSTSIFEISLIINKDI